MCNNFKKMSGFTLLEMIAVLGIAGIVMAMAIPSFNDMIRRNRLTTYANEFVTALNIARSESVKRGVNVSVRKNDSTSSSSCPATYIAGCTATYWSSCGWSVFVDNNANGTCDTGEDVLRVYSALPNGYTLNGTKPAFTNYISYKPEGTSNTAGSFFLCDNRDNNNTIEPYTAKVMIVSMTGRVQMARDKNGDGKLTDNNNSTITSCGL